jgi:hypothetical protein
MDGRADGCILLCSVLSVVVCVLLSVDLVSGPQTLASGTGDTEPTVDPDLSVWDRCFLALLKRAKALPPGRPTSNNRVYLCDRGIA